MALEKYDLHFEVKDVNADSTARDEMLKKSGQGHTPCVEIDDVVLADTTGQEVEDYLMSCELVRTRVKNVEDEDALEISMHMDAYIAGVRLADTTRFF